MARETKELQTLGGKKVTVVGYLNGKENNIIKSILFEGVTVDSDKNMSKMPLTNAIKREEKLIELAVQSFDNSTENIVGRIQELPSEEYDELIKQLDAALKINFQKAK